MNRLRNGKTATPTDKIFLQLLSTVTQHLSDGEGETAGDMLTLLDDIRNGLETSSSKPDQVQKQLLHSVSQVLLMQQKKM